METDHQHPQPSLSRNRLTRPRWQAGRSLPRYPLKTRRGAPGPHLQLEKWSRGTDPAITVQTSAAQAVSSFTRHHGVGVHTIFHDPFCWPYRICFASVIAECVAEALSRLEDMNANQPALEEAGSRRFGAGFSSSPLQEHQRLAPAAAYTAPTGSACLPCIAQMQSQLRIPLRASTS